MTRRYDVDMRITLNVDDDVLDRARALANQRNKPLGSIINDALRCGLEAVDKQTTARPYSTDAHPLGVKQGRNLDNIQELLGAVEGRKPNRPRH